MKKIFYFLITGLMVFNCINITEKSAKAEDSSCGYFVGVQEEDTESDILVTTNSPWVNNTNFEISFNNQTVGDSQYLAFDYNVTISKNNPELVTKLGVDGVTFTGPDGVTISGSSYNVLKQFGDWFFLPPGRNTLFISVEDYLISNEFSKFGLYFDTGFANRAGCQLEIYGLYLVNEKKTDGYTNIINFSTLNNENISNIGTTFLINISHKKMAIEGVDLFNGFNNGMKIHVKALNEGGKTIQQPNDYGFISIDLGTSKDISCDDGIAFHAYANNGDTFFQIVLEDGEGHFFTNQISGSDINDPSTFSLTKNGLPGSMLGFYGCLFLENKDFGVVYLPYSDFYSLGSFFGNPVPSTSSPISSIKKIHIGMDMLYGLGRTTCVNEFASCNIEQESITSLINLSELTDEEWNRSNYALSSRVSCQGMEQHRNNFSLSSIEENELPGAKEAINLTYLTSAINLANSLNKEEYTEKSWDVVEVALMNAQNLLEYYDLYEQSDINKATSDLMISIRHLEYDENKQRNNNDKSGCSGNINGSITICVICIVLISFLIRRKELNYEK